MKTSDGTGAIRLDIAEEIASGRLRWMSSYADAASIVHPPSSGGEAMRNPLILGGRAAHSSFSLSRFQKIEHLQG